MVAHRVAAIGGSLATPAAWRLMRVRPWSAGLGLLAWAYVLCYVVPLPLLPAWLFVLYLINAAALRLLGDKHTEPWEPTANRAPSEDPAHALPHRAAADGALAPPGDRLRALEDVLLPMVERVEAACSYAAGALTASPPALGTWWRTCPPLPPTTHYSMHAVSRTIPHTGGRNVERLASAPLATDARAAALVWMALLLALLGATLACSIVSMAVLLAGGARHAAFYAFALGFLLHLVRPPDQTADGTCSAQMACQSQGTPSRAAHHPMAHYAIPVRTAVELAVVVRLRCPFTIASCASARAQAETKTRTPNCSLPHAPTPSERAPRAVACARPPRNGSTRNGRRTSRICGKMCGAGCQTRQRSCTARSRGPRSRLPRKRARGAVAGSL